METSFILIPYTGYTLPKFGWEEVISTGVYWGQYLEVGKGEKAVYGRGGVWPGNLPSLSAHTVAGQRVS
jgi:hypothetical protein